MFAKKNVVAAAALTLLAVAAQAQVTVYGTADVSVGRKQVLTKDVNGDFVAPVNGKLVKTSSTNVDSSDMSQSFVGIKGQEDLGNGLKAVFKLEAALEVDTGTATGGSTNFFGQNATVGLAGDFGAVNLGRFENLFKLQSAAFNPFGASKTFSPSVRALGVDQSSWSNGVSYVSPNLSGLTLSAQYSAKEAAVATATNYSGGAYDLAANYTAGPLGLSAVYGEVKSTNGVTAPAEKARPWLLGASYDFSIVKLYAQYGETKYTTKATDATVKAKGFQAGVGIPVTANGAVLVSYGEGKVSGTDEKTRDASLGYTHNLSKRTNVYAAYNNERTRVTGASGTTNSFAVGVRHSF
ncbi:MAG: porin [Pseudomonadota bacterium]